MTDDFHAIFIVKFWIGSVSFIASAAFYLDHTDPSFYTLFYFWRISFFVVPFSHTEIVSMRRDLVPLLLFSFPMICSSTSFYSRIQISWSLSLISNLVVVCDLTVRWRFPAPVGAASWILHKHYFAIDWNLFYQEACQLVERFFWFLVITNLFRWRIDRYGTNSTVAANYSQSTPIWTNWVSECCLGHGHRMIMSGSISCWGESINLFSKFILWNASYTYCLRCSFGRVP